jgi:hypothetical protein
MLVAHVADTHITPGRPTLVLMRHPPFVMGTSRMDRLGLGRRSRFRRSHSPPSLGSSEAPVVIFIARSKGALLRRRRALRIKSSLIFARTHG